MYVYTAFDQTLITQRAAQYRDQLQRWQAGDLSEDAFRPQRLQNGWYVQRYAPMLRVAVPYGELHSRQLRVLARVAREYDQPDAALLAAAQATQDVALPIKNRSAAHFEQWFDGTSEASRLTARENNPNHFSSSSMLSCGAVVT